MTTERRIPGLISKIAKETAALSVDERRVLNTELEKFVSRSESVSENFGSRGRSFSPANITINNFNMDVAEGIYLRDPSTGYKTVELQLDGDAFFGNNLANAADTSLIIFSNNQTYNSESMGAGDVLMGDNSASKANLLWDKSAGQVKFRNSTTTNLYIDTDGDFILSVEMRSI